jgi:hypothetical protein
MKNFNRTYLLIAAAALLVALACAAVAEAKTNKQAVSKGATWIRKARLSQFPGTGFQSDTISALAAAKKIGVSGTPDTIKRFRKVIEADASSYAGSAGASGKLILAAVASGARPRCFGPDKDNKSDLYNILMSNYNKDSGQFGRTAFDQGLAMVALKAAHQKVPSKAVSFVKKRRGKYGWNFAMSAKSGDDVESTALIIEGMRAAGVSKKSSILHAGYRWITFQRNPDGGYNPDLPQGETQADTTAYAIRAADALGIDNKKAKRALRALQKNTGSFRSTPGVDGDFKGIATSNAVTALAGSHYPVIARSKADVGCG